MRNISMNEIQSLQDREKVLASLGNIKEDLMQLSIYSLYIKEDEQSYLESIHDGIKIIEERIEAEITKKQKDILTITRKN
jgi:hypothetical protein